MSQHRPRKRFGQHFLHDPVIIERIVRAIRPLPGQRLVEIGPGRGALTGPLLAAAGRLTAIEIDRDLAGEMRERYGAQGLDVACADVLGFDFRCLAAGATLRVVGNLPYNISTPLIFHLLGQTEVIEDLHIMVQREVGERLAAGPGSGAYGRLSVMVALKASVEPLFRVRAGAFQPPPKVESMVVRLRPHATLPVPPELHRRFAWLVQHAFSQRRKTLRRILVGHLTTADIEAADVAPSARPESLALAAFARLAARLEEASAPADQLTHKGCG